MAENERIFWVEEEEDVFVHRLIDPRTSQAAIKERNRRSLNTPTLLDLPMRLTQKQWDEIGYTYAGEKPHYFETTVDGVTVRLGLAKHVIAQEVMGLGLMPLLGQLQAILGKPEIQTAARKAQLAKNRNKNGLNLGFSRSTARGKEGGTIQHGKAVRKVDEVAELNAILGELAPQLIEYAFPETKGDMFVGKWAGNASDKWAS